MKCPRCAVKLERVTAFRLRCGRCCRSFKEMGGINGKAAFSVVVEQKPQRKARAPREKGRKLPKWMLDELAQNITCGPSLPDDTQFYMNSDYRHLWIF